MFTDYKIVGNLLFDELAIRSKVEWFAGKTYGFEDFGGAFINDSTELARQPLVFLFNRINTNWKISLGNFLCKSVSGNQKKELVLTCLNMIHTVGVITRSVTFDGTSTNLTMAESLGCKLSKQNLKTFLYTLYINNKFSSLLIFVTSLKWLEMVLQIKINSMMKMVI